MGFGVRIISNHMVLKLIAAKPLNRLLRLTGITVQRVNVYFDHARQLALMLRANRMGVVLDVGPTRCSSLWSCARPATGAGW